MEDSTVKVLRPQKEMEIKRTADVLVVGGGPAGIGAAVSASRLGKKVLLLEKRGFLGGNITACYVENCNHFLKGTSFSPEGIYAEIEQKCYEIYGNDNIREKNKKAFHSEYLKIFLDKFLAENKVEVFLHSFVNEVITCKDLIEAVIIQTKQGPEAVKADIIIDATGDGDVAFGAGLDFEQGREKDGICQPGTVNFRVTGAHIEEMKGERLTEISHIFTQESREGRTGLACSKQDIPFGRLTKAGQITYINYSCAHGIDPTDIEGLTRGEMECREYILEIYEYLKNNFHELRDIEITSIAPEIGFRDSRRIRGKYYLTIDDMETNRQFEDVVAVFPRFYDMLSPDGKREGNGKVDGKGYDGHIFEPITDGRTFQVPYRALVPAGISNLLLAGRCISADHVAESGIRAVSLCMLMGQAAGTAAFLALEQQVKPAEIDCWRLQEILREQGITIPIPGK